MHEKFEAVKDVKITISYNEKMGGEAADSVKKSFAGKMLDLSNCDYRVILPEGIVLTSIFKNKNFLFGIIQASKIEAAKLLQNKDGLIIPGNGSDVDQRLYNDFSNNHFKNVDLPRAIAEMALTHIAMQKGMPILAICGGHQIINVYLGGSLKDVSFDDLDRQGYMSYSNIGFNPESEMAKIFFDKYKNKEKLQYNGIIAFPFFGAHTQAIDSLAKIILANGDSLISNAAIADDSHFNIEAFETNYGAPIYSMQFHPEIGIHGMYSLLMNKISYQSKHPETISIYSKIFDAFKQAGITYHLKQSINTEITSKKTIDIKNNELEVKRESTKAVPKDNASLPLNVYSFFMEASTKDIGDTKKLHDFSK